ncbi:MAG: hypothetical protein KGZ25_11620, partial [Planctomycetes bacterium]|nr:hypothetical protein [Planctomycetota bacterium]
MLRKTCVIALCLAFLLVGCRKKGESAGGTANEVGGVSKAKVKTPPGYVRIPEASHMAFVRKDPLRIGEYVAYLKETGQNLPDRLKSPDVDYQDPVTGLSRQQAQEAAGWQMLRILTAEEWEKGKKLGLQGEYPWGETVSEEDRKKRKIFLVRDWASKNSPKYKTAKENKGEIRTKYLSKYRQAVKEFQDKIQKTVQETTEELKGKWKALKPKIFDLAEAKKRIRKNEAWEAENVNVIRVLGKLQQKKLQFVNKKFADGATDESVAKAKKAYEAYIETAREKIEARQKELLQDVHKASDKVVELTQQIEKAGGNIGKNVGDLITEVQEIPADVDEVEKVNKQIERIRDIRSKAVALGEKQSEILGKMLAEVEEELKTVNKKLRKIEEEEDTPPAKIDKLKESLKKMNERLEAQFEQENAVINAVKKLADLAARKKALQTQI